MKNNAVSRWVRENVDGMHPVKWNVMQFRKGFTEDTIETTFAICKLAWLDSKDFAVEVLMKNGCRADIVVPEWVYPVIEIMDSEGVESIKKKRAIYNEQGLWFLEVPAQPFEALQIVCLENGIK